MTTKSEVGAETRKPILCDHKCHREGLNPWVRECPICGCPNDTYDPNAEVPEWLTNFLGR